MDKIIVDYLARVLAADTKIFQVSPRLPMYLLNAYNFIGLDIIGVRCVAAINLNDEALSPMAIKKQMMIIEKTLGMPAIYVCRGIKAWNRDRLIAQRVQFMVPGNQMYLPALGMDLRDYYLKARREEPKEGLTPAAQVVLIALLSNNEQSQADLSGTTGYTRMSISRAIDELVLHQLVETEFRGKLRIAKLAVKPKAAFRAMQSPVREHFFVAKKPAFGIRAGMGALEMLTSISADHETLAVSQTDWKILRKNIEIVPFGNVEIEVWRYNPAIFAKNETADRISLYLSLRDDKNERVQKALQEMMEVKHG